MKTISLIDMDGMLYHSCRDTSLEDSITVFKEKLQNCLDQTKCNYWSGFIGKGESFRKRISKDYKSNRKSLPPKYLKALKEWVLSEYFINVCIDYEADDAVSYYYNKDINLLGKEVSKILCSPDKDLLQGINSTVGCDHFNYSYKLREKDKPETVEKGWWIKTSIEEAEEFKLMQLVVGDSADCISGLRGRGIKYWENLLLNGRVKIEQIFADYLTIYGNWQGVYEFQKNFRLLYILKTDYDFTTEIGRLPEELKINTIYKEESKIYEEF